MAKDVGLLRRRSRISDDAINLGVRITTSSLDEMQIVDIAVGLSADFPVTHNLVPVG